MDDAKPVSTPLTAQLKLSKKQCPYTYEKIREMENVPYASTVGSLMYAMVCTRPDIAHAVSTVSRFLANLGELHWEVVVWIMRYLCGTSGYKICFGGKEPTLVGYTDSDMAGDLDSSKSTSGFLFTYAGGAISWKSRLQKCIALSTTEAEFIVATEAGKELVWLKRMFEELGIVQDNFVLLGDNQSAIHLSKNLSFHNRSKHIKVKYHWICDAVNLKEFEFEKVHTNDNGSDMLTKVVTRDKLLVCNAIAGLVDSSM